MSTDRFIYVGGPESIVMQTMEVYHYGFLLQGRSHSKADDDPLYQEAFAWCVDQFGPCDRVGSKLCWFDPYPMILIMREVDAIAFRMRWC